METPPQPIQDSHVSGDTETSADTSGQTGTNPVQADTDVFTERDYKTDYDESGSVLIQLNGSTAAATSDSVRISGTTITITEDAVYRISGTLDDGMMIVNAPDTAKLQLVFDGSQYPQRDLRSAVYSRSG